MLLKTVTLCSRNPIFRQTFVCTREMHFWRLCRNFWAKYGKSSYWNPKIDQKFDIVRKIAQNWLPECENSVLLTVNKQGCAWSKKFPLSVPKSYEKLSSFEELFFIKMIFRTVKSSSDNLDELFHQNPTLFSVKSKCYEKKCYTFPRKTNLASNFHLYR